MTFENGANSPQMEYFRRRLLSWRDALVSESGEMACPSDKEVPFDFIGRVANMTNNKASSQSLDGRKQKLICKIDETLYRIKAGTYGA